MATRPLQAGGRTTGDEAEATGGARAKTLTENGAGQAAAAQAAREARAVPGAKEEGGPRAGKGATAIEEAVGIGQWVVAMEATAESAAPAVARTAFAWWPDLEEDAAVPK